MGYSGLPQCPGDMIACGTEFLLTARRATTGEILLQHDVRCNGLGLHLEAENPVGGPFEGLLPLIFGSLELNDTYLVGQACSKWRWSYKLVGLAPDERKRELGNLQDCKSRYICGSYWQVASEPPECAWDDKRVSPLVLAINSPHLEEATHEFPGMVFILLYGNCNPNEFGQPEISHCHLQRG